MFMKELFILMRPHQYIKNIFIILPLFFALKITDIHLVSIAILIFIGFSLIASSIYILNDYIDREEDKLHPKKRLRPLASGKVSKKEAIIAMFLLSMSGFTLILSISLNVFFIVLFYVLLNIAYSLYFKHIAIIDIVIIAIGFVLRLFIGAVATGITLSQWIVVMTFLLALFMALAKRRDDVLIYNSTGKKMRKVIDGYNIQFLDTAMAIMAAIVIVAYVIYTTLDEVIQKFHSNHLYLTALFVIIGILRYLQISFVHLDSGSPTKIVLRDRFMQVTLIGWLISFLWILYI